MFMDVLFQFIYNTELVPVLPQMIQDAQNGRLSLIGAYYPLIAFLTAHLLPRCIIRSCALRMPGCNRKFALDEVNPRIAASQRRDTAEFLRLCYNWIGTPLGERADAPVSQCSDAGLFGRV